MGLTEFFRLTQPIYTPIKRAKLAHESAQSIVVVLGLIFCSPQKMGKSNTPSLRIK